MSAFAKQLIGEMTSTGDVAPVMTGAPVISNPTATGAKRRIPTSSDGQKKKLRNRVASGIIGQLKEDSRDGYVIPDNAKEVTKMEIAGDGLTSVKSPEVPGQKIKNPYSGEEPLILPAASLVAPDVTPEAIFPLDPSQIPGGDRGNPPEAATAQSPSAFQQSGASSPVVDLVLGKPPGGSAPAPMSTEAALSRLPGIPSPTAVALDESAASADVVVAGQQPGIPMPEHKDGNPRAIMDAFSRFVPRGKRAASENVPVGAPSFTHV